MFRKLLVSLLCFSCCVSAEKIAILIPFDQSDTNDVILTNQPVGNFWYKLKLACAEQGYTLTTKRNHKKEDVFAVVAFNACKIPRQYAHAKSILFTWEPPCVLASNFMPRVLRNFDYVMTWNDALVDGLKYRKFNYVLGFGFPETVVPFREKKLCCMFVGNKSSSDPNELYSKRKEMVDFFEAKAANQFDFYGPGWSKKKRVCYRGYAQDKIAVMKRYRFPIVYENSRNIPGYITEKIFDAFSSGCVPVYWGAPNVTQWIPQNTFIAREHFASNAELYTFLKNMPESVYNEYLENIRTFLSSEQAHQFSPEQFIKMFVDALASCD